MWFTFVTARLFISPSFQPRLAATLLRSCSAVNSPTRRVGLAPTFKPASLAQAPFAPVKCFSSVWRWISEMRFPRSIRRFVGQQRFDGRGQRLNSHNAGKYSAVAN